MKWGTVFFLLVFVLFMQGCTVDTPRNRYSQFGTGGVLVLDTWTGEVWVPNRVEESWDLYLGNIENARKRHNAEIKKELDELKQLEKLNESEIKKGGKQ